MLNDRKQIAAFLFKIAKRMEEDEEFAKEFLNDEVNAEAESKVEINIFEIYQNNGPEGLIKLLIPLDQKELKKIVLDNGLDPSQKVRRWRKQEKIVQFVVESIAKQMAKGGAFLK